MPKPIKLKIDVTKLDKTIFFKSEKTGAIYCDLVAWPSRDSQYGDTHTLSQERPRNEPDKKMPICGNMTIPDDGAPRNEPVENISRDNDEQDDIPF